MPDPIEEVALSTRDLAGIAAALEGAGLPADDIAAPGVRLFEYRIGGRRAGYGGMERHGHDVLLRSIVVLPEARGRGAGRAIVALLLRRAADEGSRRAFLLTRDAQPFFERLGFEEADRAGAPDGIRATRQMAALCPATASLLSRSIG